nr:hypothetical protein CFP56_03727 [Quercus suber]
MVRRCRALLAEESGQQFRTQVHHFCLDLELPVRGRVPCVLPQHQHSLREPRSMQQARYVVQIVALALSSLRNLNFPQQDSHASIAQVLKQVPNLDPGPVEFCLPGCRVPPKITYVELTMDYGREFCGTSTSVDSLYPAVPISPALHAGVCTLQPNPRNQIVAPDPATPEPSPPRPATSIAADIGPGTSSDHGRSLHSEGGGTWSTARPPPLVVLRTRKRENSAQLHLGSPDVISQRLGALSSSREVSM